jgi:predicted RecA/RadA family phage recombinase
MATNEVFKDAASIPLVVGASVAARSAVVVGKIPGVALTATGSSGTTTATVALEGVYNMSVVANNGGATTIAIGDIIYHTGNNGAPVLNVNSGGTRWGYALDANSGSGTTTTIRVLIGY